MDDGEGITDEIAEIIATRKQQAIDFYRKHNPDMREAKIQEHLKGIDFTKPVYVVKIPPNGLGKNKNELYQYTKLDNEGNVRQGNYYTDNPKNTPTELGISDKYSVRDNNWKPTGEIKEVEQNVFEFNIENPVEGLKSTSKPIIDDWSIENIDGVKIEVPTKGGGSQIYIPKQ
ncbi:polymorphic toxin type 46 domain-containing protein [Capnocytophaga cynodegmi]|uniref:polymorphic toxin type 46 domain-containing protein n=1 Tax=Capnocytophaga cynodegmi TaxID=28189 RepID=UPI00385E9A57